MEYRRLGKSGLQLSALSLGSWLTMGERNSDSIAEELMTVAYENGVNFFDSAESYAHGKSEMVIGTILKKKQWPRDSYIVSSKAFFGMGGQLPTQVGLHRKHLVEACEGALKRLQVDYLDLYFCHRPDKQTPIEETVWTMHNLIVQGKILYWGTSEWSAQEITEAHMVAQRFSLIAPVMEQPQYNMLVRHRVEVEYDQLYKTVGLGTTVWSPLASGVLSGKYNDGLPSDTRLGKPGLDWLKERSFAEGNLPRAKKLAVLCNELGVSMPVVALAWCLKNPHVSSVILGASKVAQLHENLKALDVQHQLTSEIIDRIESLLDNKPEKPKF